LIRQLGEDHGISAEDCAYIDIAALRSLYGQSGAVATWLKESVADGKRRHALARSLVLPPLVTQSDDAWTFHLPATHPNYVTQMSVTGLIVKVDEPPERLAGAIVFIPSADPGFDWIFTRGIAGFVTQFGGVNSHMAIRAGELGIPAAIGVGEALYRTWGGARRLCLDCGSRQVQVLP
jgi:phosphohistidine swiveling domain-containing protein